MAKYDPLHDHLKTIHEDVVKLTFGQIERILGASLPKSARTYNAWWANEKEGSHARSWLDAGFATQRLDLNAATVEFSRQRRR